MHDARESGNPEPKPKPTDAFANLRERFGAYFDAIPDVDAFVKEQRSGDEWPRPLPGVEPTPDEWAQRVNMPGAPASGYTLTPWPESVDKRLARLELELSRLRAENERLAELVRRLEDGK